ncbi:hypothetical protein N7448_009000 [Penicillium atrosanguineum]|uniref:Uncharacterized protein n=1 Tax=Penicillium atrosanguineum TaxID=1132637 RepID=A0A9W9KW84_9EURO|nr:alpha-L-arabinofuranosidase axhA [Penicillium atrosanguineum]KAJ5122903.1 hypothetical protein N7448_009000 [Penicillium atrosanguineum]KAJ5137203.1 hypothetical protein N7526_003436 [Penicillium atrosanguineum]KAJ5298126.1 alpha-L-arabinofuranosidase axhA [Penicillium atrosanguineum]KAJ5321605.1 hypothetical protein N7476_004607 [Penicillium atrosanguineum]
MTRSQAFDVTIDTGRKSSLLAEMVHLNRILLQINDFNVRAPEEELDPKAITSNIKNLSHQLDLWFEELPNHIWDTRENMERCCSTDSYMTTQGFTTQTRYYADKCKQHASSLCDIVHASDEEPGCDVKYNMIGHVPVISSTV